MALASSPMNGDASPRAVAARAREAADRAVRAQPELAEAQHARAYVAWMLDWDWHAAERGFRQALRIDPRMAFDTSPTGTRCRNWDVTRKLQTRRAKAALLPRSTPRSMRCRRKWRFRPATT